MAGNPGKVTKPRRTHSDCLVRTGSQKHGERQQRITEKYTLDAVDQMLLRQLADHPNTSQRELGAMVAMSGNAVRKRLAKPAFRKAMAEALLATDELLASAARTALKRLTGLIGSADERIALLASQRVLELHHARTPIGTQTGNVTYAVQFGEGGQIYQTVIPGTPDTNVYPTTRELLEGI